MMNPFGVCKNWREKGLMGKSVGEFLVIPSLKAHRSSSGNFVLTEKFLSGMREYAARWPGTVTAMVAVRDHPDSNLDHVEVKPGEQPFNVEAVPVEQKEIVRRMKQADLVFGGPLGISGVRQATVKEYGLMTRLQITAAGAPHLLRRWKRLAFATAAELRWRRAARKLAGIQCNGVPAYNECKSLNSNVMLFFDNRIAAEDLIQDEELQQRLERLLSGAPLRLAFTGRLLKIKGVDHLPIIAAELKRLGVRFEMSICGGGESEQQLVRMIQEGDLTDQVCLRGILNYRDELLPLLREDVDLFVCTHTQGDPACTYLETMACGIPIVGYANEAWAGLAPLSRAGWVTPFKKPLLIAAKIAELDQNRTNLANASRAARDFAAQHTFKLTMDRRVQHLLTCLSQLS
ncbi:MAG: hypothetical protein C0613_10745 [Desulfobulbaceae bacterium]|nr:MAG: hypothetical protein C0613_10745 [Desulfobulbaceae bacterium]